MSDDTGKTEGAEPHTELRAHDAERARAADAKRNALAPRVPLPETLSDDALDDLFNDMPV